MLNNIKNMSPSKRESLGLAKNMPQEFFNKSKPTEQEKSINHFIPNKNIKEKKGFKDKNSNKSTQENQKEYCKKGAIGAEKLSIKKTARTDKLTNEHQSIINKKTKPRLNKPISDVPTKSNKPINETQNISQNRVKKGLESDSKTNLTKIDWEREYEETKKNIEHYHQQKKNLKEYIKRNIKEKESFSKHKDLERQLKFVRNEIEQLEKQIKELESINPTQKIKKK